MGRTLVVALMLMEVWVWSSNVIAGSPSYEDPCALAFFSSSPLFEELVRLRRSIDDGSASDSERRARQSDYRVRVREAVKRLDIERELLVSTVEARVREERGRPLVKVRSTEITDLAPRTVMELAEEGGIERVTLSGKRYLEFFEPTWKMRAWRDKETGLIWSDVIRGSDGKVLRANHRYAEEICAELGGRLATKEEYEKLRADFGKVGTDEYAPQIFMDGKDGGHTFWSLSILDDDSRHAYYFLGRVGVIGFNVRNHSYSEVRCVRP